MKNLKHILPLVVILASGDVALAEHGENGSLIEATRHYEFHSNFWMNLHHYLYALAKRPVDRPLESTRGLSAEERRTLADSVVWYRENFGEADLLFDQRLYAIKRALIDFEPDEAPVHDAVSEEHREQLMAAKPIYARHFWPGHDRQNRETVAWNMKRLVAHEVRILNRIAELAQQSWPDGRIRVDLTWHANWAGAYCTVTPIHAVITSRNGGPDNTWPPSGWFELVFHEPSHALIGMPGSTVDKVIGAVAAELDMEPPRQLWHAMLFYFSGTAVREALASEDVDIELLMVSDDIFSRYHDVVFANMPAYVAGDATLEEAIRATLVDISQRQAE